MARSAGGERGVEVLDCDSDVGRVREEAVKRIGKLM
jgi:hypothetical protein